MSGARAVLIWMASASTPTTSSMASIAVALPLALNFSRLRIIRPKEAYPKWPSPKTAGKVYPFHSSPFARRHLFLRITIKP